MAWNRLVENLDLVQRWYAPDNLAIYSMWFFCKFMTLFFCLSNKTCFSMFRWYVVPIYFIYIFFWLGVHVPHGWKSILLPFVQALIWSKMSTGLPIEILSSMTRQSFSSFCRLDIDINKYDWYILGLHYVILFDLSWHWCLGKLTVFKYNESRNIPHIHVHEKRENKDMWHGAEIQIVIEGNWTTYRVWSVNWFYLEASFVMDYTCSFCLWIFFASAVQDTTLHAANGCDYTICTIAFQVSVRISRVLVLSQILHLHFLLLLS